MPATLTVHDQLTTGDSHEAITLEFPTERITVRELIRERVYQEVKDYNARRPELFRGLVQPTDAERQLNGFRLKRGRQIDWRPQYDKALAAFEAGQVLVLVGDRQAESLDETIELSRGVDVSFLKLVPLIGG